VPCYDDITTLDTAALIRPDVLCGGFPCQPHSRIGKRRASGDERDMWPEFVRIIRDVRPRWVVAENVDGLLSSEGGRSSGESLGTWPSSGLMRSGTSFTLARLERHTHGPGCSLWRTPTAQDSRNSTLPPSQIWRRSLVADMMRAGDRGEMNPEWVEWLMGFPAGWTALDASEMPSSRKSRKKSAG
jgi:DNA (cytosine-5)-methyltransferase 1